MTEKNSSNFVFWFQVCVLVAVACRSCSVGNTTSKWLRRVVSSSPRSTPVSTFFSHFWFFFHLPTYMCSEYTHALHMYMYRRQSGRESRTPIARSKFNFLTRDFNHFILFRAWNAFFRLKVILSKTSKIFFVADARKRGNFYSYYSVQTQE